MRLFRFTSLICAFVLIASTGCNLSKRSDAPAAQGGGKYGDPNAVAVASPSGSPDSEGEKSTSQTGSGKSQPKTSGSGTTAAPRTARITDIGGTGASNGRLILAPHPYTELNFEIDWVDGREPNPAVINHLREVMGEIMPGKKITFSGGNEVPAQSGSYRAEDIVDFASKIRDTRSETTKASIWIGYLNGTMRGGGVAGVAVGGTICTVFLDTVDSLHLPPTTRIEIEKTIIVQEVAHLLGLVNLGYRSPRDHEDRDHPGHSKNVNSVMYWALMTSEGIVDFLRRGLAPPTRFDADDLADLKDLRDGKL